MLEKWEPKAMLKLPEAKRIQGYLQRKGTSLLRSNGHKGGKEKPWGEKLLAKTA